MKNNFPDVQSFQQFYGYIAGMVNFIQIETPSVSDALKIFETINERGIGLNPMDLLKNLIFRQLDREQFKDINQSWKTIMRTLEKHGVKPLRFLRYFLMARYTNKDPNSLGIIREDQIYDWITRNADQCGYKREPLGFVRKLSEDADAFVKFINGRDVNDRVNANLENIRSLGGGAFSQHLLLLLAAKSLPGELFNLLAARIEALIFFYIITGVQTKEYEIKFSKWAEQLRNIATNADGQARAVNEFCDNVLRQEITVSEKVFDSRFMELNINSMPRYRLKYLLCKIAQYVDEQRIGEIDRSSSLESYLKKNVEIEHILPNSPKTELEEGFGGKALYEEYKVKLGNLTPLEKPINVVAGREFFAKKKELYGKSKFYLTKSIAGKDQVGVNTSITRVDQSLVSFEEWNKEAIINRQIMLLGLAKKVWGF